MHITLAPSSASDALVGLQLDEPLESRLGDTLLFHHDAGARPPRILVTSSFTRTVYYTIFTNDRDGRTSIVRGLANGPSRKKTLAAISIAQKHRLTTVLSEIPRPASASSSLLRQETLVEKQEEKFSASLTGDTHPPELETQLTEKNGADRAWAIPAWGASNPSLSSFLSDDQETLMIIYGDRAPEYLRRCIKMEKQCITLTTSQKTYELLPTLDKTLAIYTTDAVTGKRYQVVWSRTMGVRAEGEQLRVVFPASLTFYPEARGFLDAVMVALVAWQMKMHMEL
ncbi:hypothetical protein BN946_scf184940.g84 [Trametes cinnabarina]|uniref:Uncharacterized protein n=1 Tax=Pycnoporus cinnabarinus TaxID=5643 RepID=A0A060SBQ7_PYCCI|nr:hypothetical protein BN946_scf184940.g84 [Trametes cinnabarina]